jgi:hypothetical protein
VIPPLSDKLMNISLLIRFIFGMAFFQGVLSYLGMPSVFYKLIIEACIAGLFFVYLYFLSGRTKKSFNAPGLVWFVLFTFTVFISVSVNDSDLMTSILMYRQILWPYLFFIAILNIDLSHNSINRINKFIVVLVVIQVPAAIYKYVMYGVVEDIIIGTFSVHEGALSTVFPMFIIGYALALYFVYKRNPFYLLLISGFIFFAWGGGKRAFFILLPVFMLLAYYIYYKTVSRSNIQLSKLFLSFVLIILISVMAIFVGAKSTPTLNPEGSYWGSFNVSFIISKTVDYESRMGRERGTTGGRIATTKNVIGRIANSDFNEKFVGFGPDQLYMGENRRWEYGIRYGITGLNFGLISVGIAGTITLFMLFLTLGLRAGKTIKKIHDPFHKALAYGTILATIVFCFDFLMYSRAFFTDYLTSILFFYIVAIVLKHSIHDYQINELEEYKPERING